MSIKTRRAIPLLLLVLYITSSALAVTTLLSQSFPLINPTASITGYCITLVNTRTPVSNGIPQQIVYTCSGQPGAFQIVTAGSYVPSFILPSALTSLDVNQTSSSLLALTSGTPITLSAGIYTYVAIYQGTGVIGNFTVNWT